MRVFSTVVVQLGLGVALLASCTSGGRSTTDAGFERDGSPSTPIPMPPTGFETTASGTMNIQFNFLTSTFDTYYSPDPYRDTARVVANADYTHITVTTSACTVVGDYSDTRSDGIQRYNIDPTLSSCDMTATNASDMTHTVIPMWSDGTIRWGAGYLRFFLAGSGEIPDATSLINVSFDP